MLCVLHCYFARSDRRMCRCPATTTFITLRSKYSYTCTRRPADLCFQERGRRKGGDGVCVRVGPEDACGKSRKRHPHGLKWQHTRLFRRKEIGAKRRNLGENLKRGNPQRSRQHCPPADKLSTTASRFTARVCCRSQKLPARRHAYVWG